jgi:hypothetical protein
VKILVGKAGAGGDLCEAQSPLAHKFDRPPKSQMYDVAVRRQADGLGEYPREMERAARRYRARAATSMLSSRQWWRGVARKCMPPQKR